MAEQNRKSKRLFDNPEEAILGLLDAAGEGGTIALTDAAQALGGNPNEQKRWKDFMRALKAAALNLEDQGKVVAIRKGAIVTLRDVKGVYRLQLSGKV